MMNLKEDEIFNMCLVALFVDSRINGGAKISIESSFIRTGDSLFSVHSAEVMCPWQKFLRCRLQLAGVGQKRGANH